METWKIIALAILGLVFLGIIAWFVVEAVGSDGVLTNIIKGWFNTAGG